MKFDKNSFKKLYQKDFRTKFKKYSREIVQRQSKMSISFRFRHGLLCMMVQFSLYMTRQLFTIAVLGNDYLMNQVYQNVNVIKFDRRYGRAK